MAEPRRPFANPGMDVNQSFLDRLGIVRPRTGPAGVTRQGGVGSVGAMSNSVPGAPPPPGVAMGTPGRPATAAATPGLPPPAPPPPGPGPFIPPGSGTGQPVERVPDNRIPGQRQPDPRVGRRVGSASIAAPGTTAPGTVGVTTLPGAGTGGVVVPPPGGDTGGRGTPPGPRPGVTGADVTQDAAGRVFQPARVTLPTLPSRLELADYPADVAIDTPYGQMVTSPTTGKRELVFTPEGKVAYAQEEVRIRQKMGPNPLAADVNAPQMEIVPGKPAFDPWTSRWIR